MKKIDMLNERSDFVKEVLETPPNRIISYGNTFLFCFICIVLLLSWFVKYPDIVSSEVKITTHNPPVYLTTKASGVIDTLIKPNNQYVKKGEWLAIINSNAKIKHAIVLDSILKKIKTLNYDFKAISQLHLPILDLGKMQPNYNLLVKAILQYKYRINDTNFNTQRQLNTLQLNQYNTLIKGAIKEQDVAKKELNVAKLDLERHKTLLDKGVIAQQTYELKELNYLKALKILQNHTSKISEIQSQKTNLLSKDSNFKFDEGRFSFNAELDILEALKLTELSFIEWQKKHVLIANVSGEINYLTFITNHQYIEAGEKIISVIPKYNDDDYFGVAKMPIINSGKVKIGQPVHIKLLGFPETEYGVLTGVVSSISKVPNEHFYYIKIKLTKGLKTTYHKPLTFKQNINGIAEIVTDDLRLIERVIFILTQVFN